MNGNNTTIIELGKNNRRKICTITGSRADYGLLSPVLRQIIQTPELELQIIATGMHLSPEFGLTYQTIEDDGFRIDAKVETLLSSDTAVGVAKSLGLGTIGFADALQRLLPDLLLVLGDRFEIMAAVQAALFASIPVAHIAGGDTTEGAYDESIRHAVTKMSHLHFVTNAPAWQRVRQLGENPNYIYNVGSPGIDTILSTPWLEASDLEQLLDFRFRSRNLLITYHPATLSGGSAAQEFQALLDALKGLNGDYGLLFTKPNADNDGRILSTMIDDFVAKHPLAKAFTSLGSRAYLSLLRHCDAVVGNSSSGLYEAPSLKTPTVNIGDRQKGRLQASSVINCQPSAEGITEAIHTALTLDCTRTVNPYGDGNSARRIVDLLRNFRDFKLLLQKRFFEVKPENA